MKTAEVEHPKRRENKQGKQGDDDEDLALEIVLDVTGNKKSFF